MEEFNVIEWLRNQGYISKEEFKEVTKDLKEDISNKMLDEK